MSNEELIVLYRSATDPEERQGILLNLFEQNNGFICQQCARYTAYIEIEDAKQESFLALLPAVDTYDSEAGVFICWYAYHLRLYIIRAIENTGQTIRFPSGELAQIRKYKKFVREYEAEHGRTPDDLTTCKALQLTARRLQAIRKASKLITLSSIDEPMTEDGQTIADILADPCADPAETMERLEREELARALWEAVDRLPKHQAHILREVYQNGRTVKSLAAEEGKEYGTMQTHKKSALHKLAHDGKLKRYVPDDLIQTRAIKSGFSFWNNNGMSRTEWEALKLAGVDVWNL